MRAVRYMQLVMVVGALLIFASVFLPLAFLFIPSPGIIMTVIRPFDVWWLGYSLMIVGGGMLLLSIFRLSRTRALICGTAGFLLSFLAAVTLCISAFDRGSHVLPPAFLAVVIGGLALGFGGMGVFRRSQGLSLDRDGASISGTTWNA